MYTSLDRIGDGGAPCGGRVPCSNQRGLEAHARQHKRALERILPGVGFSKYLRRILHIMQNIVADYLNLHCLLQKQCKLFCKG